MFIDSDYSSDSESENTKFKSLVSYRFSESKGEQKLQKVFDQWRFLAHERLEKYQRSSMHREQVLIAKGFDGMLEYAIKSNRFKQKIILFYSKFLKRTCFDNWIQTNSIEQSGILTQKQKEEALSKFCTVLEKLDQSQRKIKKICFIQIRDLVLLKIQNEFRRTEFPPRQGITLLDQSRRSTKSFLSKESRGSRRFAPITDQVALPVPGKTIPAKENFQEAQKPKTEVIHVDKKEQKQEKQEQKKKPSQNKRKDEMQALIVKCKLLEMEIMGKEPEIQDFLKPYYYQSKAFLQERAV